MIIGVDARVLARSNRTGIEEYAINLLSRLLSLGKEHRFKFFLNAFRQTPLNFDWAGWENAEIKKFRVPNRFIFDPMSRIFDVPKIDSLIGGADVFFSPHFLLAPVSKKCLKVAAFHDLSFEYFPEFFSPQKRFWHWTLNPAGTARMCDRIIAVSLSTKADLIDLYKVSEDKIEVIYSGVGEEFKKINLAERQRSVLKKRYNLPEKFILYFGTIEPRKNIAGLIKAYEVFRQKNPDADYSLVVAGSRGWLWKDILKRANLSPFREDIKFAGFVRPADKAYLYNLASLFVYPSFFEGFGFPPLEAMACGAPVICSNNSSFLETAGNAALLIDPCNPEEIAWAIQEMLGDERLKNKYIERGKENIKRFSWDKCARETLDFLTKF